MREGQLLYQRGEALRTKTTKFNAASLGVQTDDPGDKPTFNADLSDHGQWKFNIQSSILNEAVHDLSEQQPRRQRLPD